MGIGGVYDPGANTWTATRNDLFSPVGRSLHTAVWSGSEMIVFGGNAPPQQLGLLIGGRYNPGTNTWAPMATDGTPPPARTQSVWTGNEMILWGGAVKASYEPATDSWTTLPIDNSGYYRTITAQLVWDGTEMVAWLAASNPALILFFDPEKNSYSYSNPTLPAYSANCMSAWTGSEMFLWCGSSGTLYFRSTDTSAPVNSTNSPSPRIYGTAVWDGSEVIVWGGQGPNTAAYLDSGARYKPSTDSWTTMRSATVGRESHSAVWTGTEMIVWGGLSNGNDVNTGERYNPSTNKWQTMLADATAPSPRHFHSSLWTGKDFIVWGGFSNNLAQGNGGRYDPVLDAWSAIPTGAGSPSARGLAASGWTGTDMFIWGGDKQTGAFYCGCPAGNSYRDADGDGFGDPTQTICGSAAGYISQAGDCNDASAAVWGLPGEARNLQFTDATTLTWSPPLDSGGPGPLVYDVLRTTQAAAISTAYTCAGTDVAGTLSTDAAAPAANGIFYYQVRAQNACPGGLGPLGAYSDGRVPLARACP